MGTISIAYIKAFTQDPERGNPAVVINGPLNDPQTLEVVRSARCSVAAVIQMQEGDIPIRFLYENGAIETFACGHATLAAAHVVLPEGQNEIRRTFINQQGTRIEVIRLNDGRISQTQSVPIIVNLKCTVEEVATALQLSSSEIRADLPLQMGGSPGKMKLMIPVNLKALLTMERNFNAIQSLCNQYSLTGLFPFALDAEGCDAHARHFPNRDEEDLVCGVGALALVQYLKQNTQTHQSEFTIRCGPGNQGAGEMRIRIPNDSEKMLLEGYAVNFE